MKITFEFKEVEYELPSESGNVLCLMNNNTFVELFYSKESQHFRKSSKFYHSADVIHEKVIAWSNSEKNKKDLICHVNKKVV